MSNEIKQPTYKCPVAECGSSYCSKNNLKEHTERVHQKEKKHTCPVEGCPFSSYRKYHLHRHINGVHRGIKRHTCPKEGCQIEGCYIQLERTRKAIKPDQPKYITVKIPKTLYDKTPALHAYLISPKG